MKYFKILNFLILFCCLSVSPSFSVETNKTFLDTKKQAEQGDAFGQIALGNMYEYGEGVAADKEEAVKWYRLAAEQGDADGQFYLGTMYQFGEGVAEDKEEAVKWYQLAAEQGHAGAQNNLGWFFKENAKSEADIEKAFDFFKSSAENGDVNSMFTLGQMYRNSEEHRSCEPFSESWHEDDRKGAYWIYTASMKNSTDAQALLGGLYLFGDIEGKPNYIKSYIWSAIAADKGDEVGAEYQNFAKEQLSQEELIEAEIQLARCAESNIVNCPAFFTKPHSIVLPSEC